MTYYYTQIDQESIYQDLCTCTSFAFLLSSTLVFTGVHSCMFNFTTSAQSTLNFDVCRLFIDVCIISVHV